PAVDEVVLEQREQRAVDDAGQGRDAAGHPGVQLGGPETVGGQYPVDAEGTAVADGGPQVLSGTTGELTHPRPVLLRRVPGRAEAAVDEAATGTNTRGHAL